MAGGANLGGDDDEGINDINVVPLVDIMLVLLIIFMVTTEVIQKKLDDYEPPPNVPVQLPTAKSSVDTDKEKKILLSLALNVDGALFLNGEETSLDRVETYVKDLRDKGTKLEAFIAADKRLTHGAVIKIVDKVRLLGIADVAIHTEPLEIQ